MKTSAQCTKCGSKKMIADATPIGGELSGISVSIFRNPSALIFKQRRMSALSATVCGECGYVEFYAKNPHSLFDAETPSQTPATAPSDRGSA